MQINHYAPAKIKVDPTPMEVLDEMISELNLAITIGNGQHVRSVVEALQSFQIMADATHRYSEASKCHNAIIAAAKRVA